MVTIGRPNHLIIRLKSTSFSVFEGIPQRKLTSTSITESAFAVADRNKDGHIDIPEFVFFTVNGLPKNIALKDMVTRLAQSNAHPLNVQI